MKKLLAILVALVMCLGSTAAMAELSDFDIVTTAEDNKVILDCDMGYRCV